MSRTEIPLEAPYLTALDIDERGGRRGQRLGQVLIEVVTDNGLAGWGESAPDPSFPRGMEAGEVAALVEAQLRPLAIGRDPTRIGELVAALARAVPEPLAVAAVDIALWDLAGRAQGRPVFELLGGRARESMAVHRPIGIKPADEVAEEARATLAEGCSAFKLKVGGPDFDAELAAVGAVRKIAGDRASILVDANGGWSAEEAVERVAALDEHRLAMVEQPVPAGDLAGMAQVRRATGVPVLADESCFGAAEVNEIASRGAADAVNVKLMKCGGLVGALEVAEAARAHGLSCFVGAMRHETEVARAAAFHFALSHALVQHPSGIADPVGAHLVDPPWEVRGASACPRPGIAGLGVDPDPAALSG